VGSALRQALYSPFCGYLADWTEGDRSGTDRRIRRAMSDQHRQHIVTNVGRIAVRDRRIRAL
jgi:hypothetical protein